MPPIHIVGEQNSFTYLATKRRYGLDIFEFEAHTHAELVGCLCDKKIDPHDPAIVPVWNANAGTINMDAHTRTEDILLGDAGYLLDLWPMKVVFSLGAREKMVGIPTNIYSVKVAAQQCSSWLEKHGILNTGRFKGEDTTTVAALAYANCQSDEDALLGSPDLIAEKGLTILESDVANPNNFTLFCTFNTLPKDALTQRRVSLASCIADLDGTELPLSFFDYWAGLTDQLDPNIEAAIPRIIFILRYQNSKALVLLELDAKGIEESPWPEPGGDSDLNLVGEVGRVGNEVSREVGNLLTDAFEYDANVVVFYGIKSSFIWACPALRISVHGYDADLVKACAKMQVQHLNNLALEGYSVSSEVEKLLCQFRDDEASLSLAPLSKPSGTLA